MRKADIGVIIVAAGRGERAGGLVGGPKQYRPIGGRPVIAHTVAAFLPSERIGRIVVVIHADDGALAADALADHLDRIEFVVGAATRQASVRCGLEALASDPPGVVLIHDAVRPFVTPDLIEAVALGAETDGAALPVLPLADTIKRGVNGLVEGTVDRAGLFAAQTPQGFRYDLIRDAHARASVEADATFTDDASIAEWIGQPVSLIPGSSDNVKLTLASEIAAADRHLKETALIDVRTGNGYDVHQLVPGDHVTLCGVRIPHDQTLLGHSDADVGLHALTDALLATCGAGDIGTHFPPSDPQWRGASSDRFVRHAVSLVTAKGGRICNVDITLISEAPKVAPHREAMVRAIGDMTGLSPDRISVKATTNETIGFVGRREGIAAIATASVVYGD
ncbi:bifunctional 2-C-methyl-D-erythritol 4-phosphate cytidylyltransferase/2-C-methyl-D-erythritol 2,4-cyclodiphosphate synthase [Aureimonas pseudogalii]|uniref:Bifunctional enzyme IspD/IspF n=1 Tax=Aureimonas pseudogalii TaxID=1744844 RepID=A0A7W6H4Z4_9HYPH|nr:bifunctional 2-C-methyl-D-erythritol 4-phosphate cytidylyltransferase/2-C-methyl-D-erythritol 2,4-cyclodiphosphate synthase [Aureimonas pseudogalii]MBB3998660.1 2-C-methyl-D-erythritol 4-phosphate cytidylyltransferase/2-C-methyl-D-erythritol 2,4-cyclodiphosphate synthase [Aureimonas pseudogalii]